MKIKASVIYKNKGKFEAGFTSKKDKCPKKKDVLALRISMPWLDEEVTYYMRPDEMMALVMVCTETLWEWYK